MVIGNANCGMFCTESTLAFPVNHDDQWNHFKRLKGLVETVKLKEKLRDGDDGGSKSQSTRSSKLPAFLTWLKNKGVKMNKVEIRETESGSEDFGVFLTAGVEEGEMLIEIPLTIAIDVPNAVHQSLGENTNENK